MFAKETKKGKESFVKMQIPSLSDIPQWVWAVIGGLCVIVVLVLWASREVTSDDDAEGTAVQTNRVSFAPVKLNKEDSDRFFDRGMAFLRGKSNKQVEEEYRRFMISNSGSGVLRLNKNQISGEIQRITEDRGAKFLEQVAGYDIAKFDPTKGRTAGAMMDENKIQKAGIVTKN